MGTTELKNVVIERIGQVLKPLGYKKVNKSTFARREGDVMFLVELQGWRTETFRVTINLGVFSLTFAKKLVKDASKPEMEDCHWRERIGELMPCKQDTWWDIDSVERAFQVADEIAEMLTNYGLPAFTPVSSSEKLLERWKSGYCEGLTDFERKNYISLLDPAWAKGHLNSNSPGAESDQTDDLGYLQVLREHGFTIEEPE